MTRMSTLHHSGHYEVTPKNNLCPIGVYEIGQRHTADLLGDVYYDLDCWDGWDPYPVKHVRHR